MKLKTKCRKAYNRKKQKRKLISNFYTACLRYIKYSKHRNVIVKGYKTIYDSWFALEDIVKYLRFENKEEAIKRCIDNINSIKLLLEGKNIEFISFVAFHDLSKISVSPDADEFFSDIVNSLAIN